MAERKEMTWKTHRDEAVLVLFEDLLLSAWIVRVEGAIVQRVQHLSLQLHSES